MNNLDKMYFTAAIMFLLLNSLGTHIQRLFDIDSQSQTDSATLIGFNPSLISRGFHCWIPH